MGAEKVITDHHKKEIVAGLYRGEKMLAICNRLGLIRSSVANHEYGDPRFGEQVRLARETRCFDLAEDLIEIADHAETMIDVQRLRIKSENIRFFISKLAPKTFGDNINVNVVATLDISRVLSAATERVAHIIHTDNTMLDVPPMKTVRPTTGLEPVEEAFDDISELL